MRQSACYSRSNSKLDFQADVLTMAKRVFLIVILSIATTIERLFPSMILKHGVTEGRLLFHGDREQPRVLDCKSGSLF